MEDLIAAEDVVVTLSHSGYMKVAAARRLPSAETRRTRQAGDDDQRRRFRRQTVHRQYPRLYPVLLQPRTGLLDQGLRGAAGRPRIARQTDRESGAADGADEKINADAAGERVRRRPLRVHGDRLRHREENRARRRSRGPGKGIIAVSLDRGRLPDRRRADRRQAGCMLFSDGGQGGAFR